MTAINTRLTAIPEPFNAGTGSGLPLSGLLQRACMRWGSDQLLTPAQQQRIADHCRAELAARNCDFQYERSKNRDAVLSASLFTDHFAISCSYLGLPTTA